jgi:hypothetical protein
VVIFAVMVRFQRPQRIASQFHTGWCMNDAWIFHLFLVGQRLPHLFRGRLNGNGCRDHVQ